VELWNSWDFAHYRSHSDTQNAQGLCLENIAIPSTAC